MSTDSATGPKPVLSYREYAPGGDAFAYVRWWTYRDLDRMLVEAKAAGKGLYVVPRFSLRDAYLAGEHLLAFLARNNGPGVTYQAFIA